jgi:hypothetical protein
MRTCSRCSTECADKEYCPTCVAAFPSRRDAKTMAPAERVAEFKSWAIVEIPFSMIHQRIEELVGRPVWTHEMAFPKQLIAEIESGNGAMMVDVIEKIPVEKRIAVVA